jgi:hypothetical protein
MNTLRETMKLKITEMDWIEQPLINGGNIRQVRGVAYAAHVTGQMRQEFLLRL